MPLINDSSIDRLRGELLNINLRTEKELILRPHEWLSHAYEAAPFPSPRQDAGGYRKPSKDKVLPPVSSASKESSSSDGVQSPHRYRGPRSGRQERRALNHMLEAVRSYGGDQSSPPANETDVKMPLLSADNLQKHNTGSSSRTSSKEGGLDAAKVNVEPPEATRKGSKESNQKDPTGSRKGSKESNTKRDSNVSERSCCLSDGEDDITLAKPTASKRKSLETSYSMRGRDLVQMASLEQMEELVARAGADTKGFGKKGKTKTMSDLWNEYVKAKSEFERTKPEKGGLIRCITVLKVQVFWENESGGKYKLEEFRQMHSDGRTRDISRPPSKILGVGESLGAGAQSCLREEFGIDVTKFGLELDLDNISSVVEERDSYGYPGLLTRYRIKEVSGRLLDHNGAAGNQIGLPALRNFETSEENDQTGHTATHFWKWKAVASIPQKRESGGSLLTPGRRLSNVVGATVRIRRSVTLEKRGSKFLDIADMTNLQKDPKTLDSGPKQSSSEDLGKEGKEDKEVKEGLEEVKEGEEEEPVSPKEELYVRHLNKKVSLGVVNIPPMKGLGQLEECLKNHDVPIELFGKGKAKTLLELWEEYLTNKLVFQRNESGKLQRRVKVLKVRVVSECPALGDRTLVEIGQQLPGRHREDFDPPKLPAKIMYAQESIKSGITRCVKEELKVDEMFIKVALSLNLKDVKNWEESLISKGYPGLLTVYDLSEVWVRVKAPEKVDFALGLPKMEDFTTYDEKGNSLRGITHYWGWRGMDAADK